MSREQASNTGKKQANRTVFKKGDSRINRNGRPRAFDDLRKIAQKIAIELVADPKDQNKKVCRINKVLRQMADSKQHCMNFIEIAYGKVPQDLNMNINNLAELFASVQDKKT